MEAQTVRKGQGTVDGRAGTTARPRRVSNTRLRGSDFVLRVRSLRATRGAGRALRLREDGLKETLRTREETACGARWEEGKSEMLGP